MFPKAEVIASVNREILEDIKIELVAQGHNLTGKTIASLRSTFFIEGDVLVLEGYGSTVIAILNYGTAPERIPYDPDVKTGAKSSKYIEALTVYAKRRFGISAKEAKSAAFAIARKQKEEGMPTKNSYKFSETGERLSAVAIAFQENEARYDQKIGESFDLIMQSIFDEQKSEVI